MKKKFIYIFLLFFPLFTYADAMQQAVYILERVSKFHKTHPKITGNFTLSVNGKENTGIFFSYATESNKSLKLFFGTKADMDKNPDYYTYWVVDKNKLWIYLNDYKVLVEQQIPSYFNTIGILGSGLSNYFASYKKFSMEEITVPGEVKGDEVIINRLNFSEPIKDKAPFYSISVDITPDGLQEKTHAVSIFKEGKKETKTEFTFSISNINLEPDFNEKNIFKVNPSGNIQILRNVLVAN